MVLKEVMTAFARAFHKNAKDYVTMSDLLPRTDMHRLTLDKYIRLAMNEGLIGEKLTDWFIVTEKGYDYLVAHNLVEA